MTPEASRRVGLAGVAGKPIGHSRSPAIMRAGFAAAGLDWRFEAFEVDESQADDFVAAVRTLQIDGVSVTMPLKEAVIEHLDRLDAPAERLGAVNCIARHSEELVGYNTDGAGLVSSLTHEGVDVAGANILVIGAGGAARAIIAAVADAGAAEVVVVNRSANRAETAAGFAGDIGSVGEVEAARTADIAINATSIGMAGTQMAGRSPIRKDLINPDGVVVDIVYKPLETPLLKAARSIGARPIDGLGMLAGQAAVAFSIWTGTAADTAAMLEAARPSE